MQIIETAHESLEIADAVAIGIHETGHRQAINHRVFIPKIVYHKLLPFLFQNNKNCAEWNLFRSVLQQNSALTLRRAV